MIVNNRNVGPVDVPDDLMMIDFLDEYLNLTGARLACGEGMCHACAIVSMGRTTQVRGVVGPVKSRSSMDLCGWRGPTRLPTVIPSARRSGVAVSPGREPGSQAKRPSWLPPVRWRHASSQFTGSTSMEIWLATERLGH
ncbi:hypothetical protein [Mesorhizobium sp. WSM3866]|uniref:hypothetical protein n=1 Tax=Mesorhizobium sp. WSM3866 TaxID=422271 RepID=UPI00159696AF|nr:hypothetical protein [Mesorhizobium sp. WSM3866]